MTPHTDIQPVPEEIPVLVVGMGPTGLMLAGELQLHGVSCLVLGTSGTPPNESRALGFTPSMLEIFGHRDMLDEFGPLETSDAVHFAGIPIPAAFLTSPYRPVLRYPQFTTESVLLRRAERLGAGIRPGHTVEDVQDHGEFVETLAHGPEGPLRVRSRYVVGCDGARSTVRGIAGLDFSLTEPTVQMLLADIEHASGLPNNPFGKKTPDGMVMSGPISPDTDRLIVCDFHATPLRRGTPVGKEHLEQAYRNVTGGPLPDGRIGWASYFNDASGLAPSFRKGSVFLAGDAAHTHLPAGGQGMNTSLQDAVNLAWKLAAALQGWGTTELLDSYDRERRQAALELLTDTRAQGQLFLRGPEVDPVREILQQVLAVPGAATVVADRVTGMGLRHAADSSSPEPAGRLLPTKHLRRDGGDAPPRGLLREGRGILLRLGGGDGNADRAATWKDRIDIRTADWVSDTSHPSLRTADVLVRPDGYVAWTSECAEPLSDALTRWFGQAS